MELEINGAAYSFSFGMGFLKEVNKRKEYREKTEIGELVKHMGVRVVYASLIDEDIEVLEDVLLTANKGMSPRLTAQALEAYIDDENTDIDALFEMTRDFLSKSNACKKEVQAFQKRMAEAQAAEKQKK